MIVPFQLFGVFAAVGFQVLIYGSSGPLFPLFCLFIGSVMGFLILSRSRQNWPSKEVRIKEAIKSFASFAALTTITYAGYFALESDFERVLISPLVGLVIALATLIISMIAGDTAAQILGVHENNNSDKVA